MKGFFSYVIGAFIALWIIGAIGMTVEWIIRWAA